MFPELTITYNSADNCFHVVARLDGKFIASRRGVHILHALSNLCDDHRFSEYRDIINQRILLEDE